MLFIVRDNEIIESIEKEFVDENEFRKILLNLVTKSPQILIAKREAETAQSLLFNPEREFPTDAGPIDLFFIDNEFYIYVIETKLYRSSERRHAISQAMDYTASLWSQARRDPDKILDLIREKTGKEFTDDEVKNIKESLINGSFEIIVAFDRIDDKIRSVIDFLNEMAEFDIYGITLKKAESGEVTVLSYEMYPEFKPQPTEPSRKKFMWNEKSFFEKVENKFNVEDYKVIRKLYDSLRDIFGEEDISWGAGATRGTCRVIIPGLFGNKYILALDTEGGVEMAFANMYETTEDLDRIIDEFADNLYQNKFMEQPVNRKNYNEPRKKYPGISFSKWKNKVDKLIEIIENFAKSLKVYNQGDN